MNQPLILLDTDLGGDCDDCGAIAVLCQAQKLGQCRLLGITHCTSDRTAPDIIRQITDWYGISVPLGQTDRPDFLLTEACARYTKPMSEAYRKNSPPPVVENAVPMLRKLLSDHTDVVFVTIGMLNNLADLLQSEPDGFSPLNGTDLVRRSVRRVVSMAGDFADASHVEYNIESDVDSARYVIENCPVPLELVPFEAGVNTMTGNTLKTLPEAHPVRQAYGIYLNGDYLRPSWDLITVLRAVTPDSTDWQVKPCRITINQKGIVTALPGENHAVISHGNPEALARLLDSYLDGTVCR